MIIQQNLFFLLLLVNDIIILLRAFCAENNWIQKFWGLTYLYNTRRLLISIAVLWPAKSTHLKLIGTKGEETNGAR